MGASNPTARWRVALQLLVAMVKRTRAREVWLAHPLLEVAPVLRGPRGSAGAPTAVATLRAGRLGRARAVGAGAPCAAAWINSGAVHRAFTTGKIGQPKRNY